MAAALPFMMAAGAVISAVGALRQGQAASSAAKFNAQVAQQNAQIARNNAQARAAQEARESYLRLGAIRAAAGGSGVASDEGSVLDVLGDAAAQGELARQQALYQGELQARGYTNTANLDESRAEQVQTGSYWKAGSELLSGGTKAYDSYANLKRT